MFLICTILIPTVLGAQILLPKLTGPHAVGLQNLELVDHSRTDPSSASGSPRDLMVSLFYPALNETSSIPLSPSWSASTSAPTLAPQFSPATAAHIDQLLSLHPGTAASLTTRAILNAPLKHVSFIPLRDSHGLTDPTPLILFSHGFGFTRGLYTALLTDLASWGWTVAAVDHPDDAAFVEYPDGRTAGPTNRIWPMDPETRERALDARVADLLFVLRWLEDAAGLRVRDGDAGRGEPDLRYAEMSLAAPVPVFNAWTSWRVAALGHSFGGATAVQMLLNGTAVAAAADLDGYLYGPVVREGTEKPVLALGFPEHFCTDDPEAAPGWPALRGWKRDFTIRGSAHESFSDYAVFADLLREYGAPEAGTVAGVRMVGIMRSYVDAFFRKFLFGGDGAEFLDTDNEFPEVSLRRRNL
ncbi:hypothetical protein F4779DRAFT_610676 [Xylariaceae sp. FL0662B]|nr:hypothetical protein F4779DRAFT_610676 [Xylariaceae sp. FL0662B]